MESLLTHLIHLLEHKAHLKYQEAPAIRQLHSFELTGLEGHLMIVKVIRVVKSDRLESDSTSYLRNECFMN